MITAHKDVASNGKVEQVEAGNNVDGIDSDLVSPIKFVLAAVDDHAVPVDQIRICQHHDTHQSDNNVKYVTSVTWYHRTAAFSDSIII
jgi:hypothetical protein